MTFLRLYGYGAVGLTLLLSCIAIQWAILVTGFWRQLFSNTFFRVRVNIVSFIYGDFAAASCLIAFGGVIGKVLSHRRRIVARVHYSNVVLVLMS